MDSCFPYVSIICSQFMLKLFHLWYRYKVIKEVGNGTFGSVWRALNKQSGEVVGLVVLANKRYLLHLEVLLKLLLMYCRLQLRK